MLEMGQKVQKSLLTQQKNGVSPFFFRNQAETKYSTGLKPIFPFYFTHSLSLNTACMFVIKIYFKNPERQTVLLVLVSPFKSLSNHTGNYIHTCYLNPIEFVKHNTSEVSFFSSPSPSSERSMKKSFPHGVLSMNQPPSEMRVSTLAPGEKVLVWGAVRTGGGVSIGSFFGVVGTESGFPFLYKLSSELFIWFVDCRFMYFKRKYASYNLDYLY